MEHIIKFLVSLTWPHVALISAILFMVLFKKPLGALIARVKSIGKQGVNLDASPQMEIEDKRKAAVDELMRIGDSIVVREVETLILKDLEARGLETQVDTVKILTRHLAITQLALDFEQIHSLIFGSQIQLLKKLNEFAGRGLPKAYLEAYFENVKNTYPDALQDWSLDGYLWFLFSCTLITVQGDNYHITNKGVEFLIWMIRTGHKENTPL